VSQTPFSARARQGQHLGVWDHSCGFAWSTVFSIPRRPPIAASQIWEYFDLSCSIMQAKSKQIRDLLGMYPIDSDWSIPSMVDKNPLIWMLEVNGFLIEVRHAPPEIRKKPCAKD
jgi:hypothetical protein